MRFFAIALHLVASAAVDVSEHCDAAVDAVSSASVLQIHAPKAAALAKTGGLQAEGIMREVERDEAKREALEREANRQSLIVDGFVERWLLSFAGMYVEGLDETQAVELCKDFADGFNVDNVDLSEASQPKTMHEAVTSFADPLHQMACKIRESDGDCESVWSSTLDMMLTTVRAAGTGLLDLVTGQSELEQKSSQRAETDKQLNSDELMELWKDSVAAGLRGYVHGGESEESVKQEVRDAELILKGKCATKLPTYMEMHKTELARKYFLNTLDTFCLPFSTPCEDLLTDMIQEVSGLSDSVVGGLLQLGARSAVQLFMKARGIPNLPKETPAERAAASAAYLKHRLAQRGPTGAAKP